MMMLEKNRKEGNGFIFLHAGNKARSAEVHADSASTAVYTALAPNRFKDFWRGLEGAGQPRTVH
jgi:hypothetical protein